MSGKRPLMLWSGGLDSTWMLWQALQKGDVDYVTVDGGQCRHKRRAEAHARSRALKWMRARTQFSVRELACHVKLHLAEMPALTWSQTVPWLVGALSVVDPKKHSSLEIGYVMGDEVSCVHDTLKRTWEGLQQVSKHGDPVPLNFPLTWVTKRRILEAIPKGLYDCIWYCELPQLHTDPRVPMRVPCECCTACITHKTELYRFGLYWTEDRGVGSSDPAVLEDRGPDERSKPQSTWPTVYVYLPSTDRYHMGLDPDQPYTLLADQVVYTSYDKIEYLIDDDKFNPRDYRTLGIQIPQPFDRYLTELAPGVFTLNQAIPSELIFAVYSYYGDRIAPKEPDTWTEIRKDGPPPTEEVDHARMYVSEQSAVQETGEDESTAQGV